MLREAREEVDQQDLDAVEGVVQHRGDQAELEQPHDRVLVHADDAVVGVGSPADDRGVDTCANRNRMIATPVMRWKQPGVLALDGPCRWGRSRSSSCSFGSPQWDRSQTISRGRFVMHRTGQRPRGVYSVPARGVGTTGIQPMRIATITPSRVGTIVET